MSEANTEHARPAEPARKPAGRARRTGTGGRKARIRSRTRVCRAVLRPLLPGHESVELAGSAAQNGQAASAQKAPAQAVCNTDAPQAQTQAAPADAPETLGSETVASGTLDSGTPGTEADGASLLAAETADSLSETGAPRMAGDTAPTTDTSTRKDSMAHATMDATTPQPRVMDELQATAAAAGTKQAAPTLAATPAEDAVTKDAGAAEENAQAVGGFLTGLQGFWRTLGRARDRAREEARRHCCCTAEHRDAGHKDASHDTCAPEGGGPEGGGQAACGKDGCGQPDCACARERGRAGADRKEAGFTLIEVMGALVVGSLVFSFAAFGISSALESARVSGFNESLALLRMNIQEVYASSRGFGSTSSAPTDITSTLVNAGAVPQNWLSSDTDSDSTTITHNFGGTVSVEGTVSNFEITVTGIPQSACRKIVSAQFENWDEVAIGGTAVTSVPPTGCLPDTGNLGVNSLLFTAH